MIVAFLCGELSHCWGNSYSMPRQYHHFETTYFSDTSFIMSFFILACNTTSLSLAIILGFIEIALLTITNPNGFLTNNFLKILATKVLDCSLNSFTKTSSICFAANNLQTSSSAVNPKCIFLGDNRFSSSNSIVSRSIDPVQSEFWVSLPSAEDCWTNFWWTHS